MKLTLPNLATLIVLVLVALFYASKIEVPTKLTSLYLGKNTANIEISPTIAQVLPSSTPTSILPAQALISAPFVPQAPEGNWEQPWQDTCEEAALLVAYYYYHQQTPSVADIKKDLLALVDYESSQSWSHDINLSQMNQVATDYLKLKTQIIENPSIQTIKQQISQGNLIVIPAAGKILFQENKNFSHGGPYYHNLAIIGYDDKSQQFITHDVGTRKGAFYRYSYNLLMKSIHDLPPSNNKEDILQGDTKIIVLLK